MKEIRRKTRVVSAGRAVLAAARLRYIAQTTWSAKCYMNMRPPNQQHLSGRRRMIECAKNLDTTGGGRTTTNIAGTTWWAKCYINMQPLYQQHLSETEAVA